MRCAKCDAVRSSGSRRAMTLRISGHTCAADQSPPRPSCRDSCKGKQEVIS